MESAYNVTHEGRLEDDASLIVARQSVCDDAGCQ